MDYPYRFQRFTPDRTIEAGQLANEGPFTYTPGAKYWGVIQLQTGIVRTEFGQEVSGMTGTLALQGYPTLETIDRLVDGDGTVWLIDSIYFNRSLELDEQMTLCEVYTYDGVTV